jgi:dTDP-3-amino-3,4,6-trideoxy-alpha-D-glucose transaminase
LLLFAWTSRPPDRLARTEMSVAVQAPETVPFVALDREHAEMAGELRAAFDRVLDRSAFILGGELAAFESEWAAACGTAHCVGTASGTAALTLLLRAAGIGRGDEVIVPANTYIASALAVVHAGAVPVLCDVEDGTGLLDPDAAAAAIGPNTAAIMAVHLFGQLCDMRALVRLAERHGLALVEDAAQAHGATFEDLPAGGFGIGAAFSFYPSKNLGALGDGGAVCTHHPDVADRLRQLRDLGQRRKGEHVVPGANERLDGLQAALLRVKLPRLAAANAARRRHAAVYRERLDGVTGVLEERPVTPCVYHLFPIRVPDRREVAARLAAHGIATGLHYTPALHHQPALQGLIRVAGEPVNAEAWAAEELSLPMSPALREDEIERAAQEVVACVR